MQLDDCPKSSRPKSLLILSNLNKRKTSHLHIVIFPFPLTFLCFSWFVSEAKPLLIYAPSPCWCPSTLTFRVLLLLLSNKMYIHINTTVLNKAKKIVKQKMTNRFQPYLVLARFITSATLACYRALHIFTLTWTTSSAICFPFYATRALTLAVFNLHYLNDMHLIYI